MITFAKAQVQGRVGSVDVKDLDNNRKVANVSVASEESYKDGDEWKKIVTWVRIVTFNPATVAYIERNVQVGREVFVSGRLRENKWEKEGVKHSTLELHADEIEVGAKLNAEAGDEDAA